MENVDFLPERIRQQRARRQRLVRQAYLVALCVAALVVLGFLRQDTISKAQAELTMLRDRSGNAERQLAMRTELEREQADLLIKKRIDDQLGSRAAALDVLAELAKLLPASMTLNNLELTPAEQRQAISLVNVAPAARAAAAKSEKVTNRIRLSITGIAPTDVDVANFIGQLSASPMFEDVSMGYSKNVQFRGRGAREFQASCYVVR